MQAGPPNTESRSSAGAEPTGAGRRLLSVAAMPLALPVRRVNSTLRGYDLAQFRGDAIAGVTVAVVAVPQCMAYAIIAGLPPSYAHYGLFTVIFESLIGALFNSQPLLSVGPNITQSLLVASTVTLLVDPGNPQLYLEMAIGLTLIKGAMQVVMASAQLGKLVRYVSQSVIVGFTSGAGVLIAVGQVKSFLGIDAPRVEGQWPGVIGAGQQLWPHLGEARWPAVAVGLVALGLVLGAKRISRLMPGPLIAIVAGTLMVYLIGWGSGDLGVIGHISRGLPAVSLPSLSLIQFQDLFAGALALSLMGLMEAYAVGKTLANKTGTRISANQELFSQGITNFLTSFLSCIPGSASFSRSALNHYAGARTMLSGIFSGVFVLLIFLLFAPAARYIPLAAIAAILFVIAWGLIDWAYIRRAMRSSRADAITCGATFVATLVLPLAYAVFVGVFLNLALYLRRASQLHMHEMVPTEAGPFTERPINDRAGRRKVIFLQVEGDLFFALADEFQDRLIDVRRSGVRVVVLRLKRTHSIDATTLGVLEQFVDQMQDEGKHVILCGVRPELLARLRGFGLIDRLGELNTFEASYGVFTSAKQALRRARELVGASIDADDLAEKEETEGWAYQI